VEYAPSIRREPSAILRSTRVGVCCLNLLEELKRRSVLRIGSAYVVGAWLVAQVAEFLLETFDGPAWVLRALVLLLSVAVVPVLVITWMFEFTPQGLQRQSELDHARVIVSRAGRKLDYVIGALLVIAAAWFVFVSTNSLRDETARDDDEESTTIAVANNSIAVLPFLNLSTTTDGAILADGVAEEILGALGRNRGLRVTARSSAFQFKEQQRDPREVGKLLGVRFLLEGSVRSTSKRVRIGAQLIDAIDGVQLWSDTYDGTLADLFEFQENIASDVAKALPIVITANTQSPAVSGTDSVEAHMEVLRARQLGASRAPVDLEVTIQHLRRAIALDDHYVAALVELAYATHVLALQRGESERALPIIEPLVDRAIELEPESGEALLLRGALLTEDDAEAERIMRRALEFAPSHARGYEILAGRISRNYERLAEAQALLDQAIALDPLAPRNHQIKGILTRESGDLAGAEPHFLRAVELEPRFRMGWRHLSEISLFRGAFAEAVVRAEHAFEIDQSQFMRSVLLHNYLHIGDVESARRLLVPRCVYCALDVLLFDNDVDAAMAIIRAPGFDFDREWLGASPVVTAALRDAPVSGEWRANLDLARRAMDIEDLPADASELDFESAQLMALLRGAGEVERADLLEARLLAAMDPLRWPANYHVQAPAAWIRAMVLANAGQSVAALDALEAAFRPARPFWWLLLDHNPMFAPLVDQPRFLALRERLAAHLAAQRVLLADQLSEGTEPLAVGVRR